MVQFSAPIVGVNLSDQDWRDLFGEEAGVVADVDGTAYALNVPTDSNEVQVGSSSQRSVARVAGFVHVVPEDDPETVVIPAATSSSRTDIIALRYDPGFTGAPGPVRLVVISGTSSGLPAYDASAPGVEELPLWAVTREPGQSLSQAAKRQLFSRLAPSLDLPPDAILPPSAPLGTVARLKGVTYRRALGASQVPSWVQDLAPDAGTKLYVDQSVASARAYTDQGVASARAYTDQSVASARAYTDQGVASARAYTDSRTADSGWVNVPNSRPMEEQPQVRKIGKVVHARGGWNNAGMLPNSTYSVGTIPAGYRPSSTMVMQPGMTSAGSVGRIVFSASGSITVQTGDPVAGYFQMDGFTWLTD